MYIIIITQFVKFLLYDMHSETGNAKPEILANNKFKYCDKVGLI